MRAGDLRHRVTIQQLTEASPSQDAGGAVDEAWTDVATVWAAVEPLKGRELLQAQTVNAEVTGNIRIRYREGITAKMRCVFESRYYNILAVVDPQERHREMILSVAQGVSSG